jgi:hypothetical protein
MWRILSDTPHLRQSSIKQSLTVDTVWTGRTVLEHSVEEMTNHALPVWLRSHPYHGQVQQWRIPSFGKHRKTRPGGPILTTWPQHITTRVTHTKTQRTDSTKLTFTALTVPVFALNRTHYLVHTTTRTCVRSVDTNAVQLKVNQLCISWGALQWLQLSQHYRFFLSVCSR